MIQCETITRKWGNSIGITLPKHIVEKENIKEQQKVRILIIKQGPVIKDTFGMFGKKLGKNTQEIKDSIRKDLYNE